MRILRKLFGVICVAYPVTLLALSAHTNWTPVNHGSAVILGYLAAIAGIGLLSPVWD